jgi:hypothetical protein
MDSFNIFLCSGCGWVSWLYISDTCVTIFENDYPLTHTHCAACSTALFPHCAESLWWISGPGTLSAYKNHITAHASSLAHMGSGVAMLILLQWSYNWSVKVESISQSQREFVLLLACKVSSLANTTSFTINRWTNLLTHLDICIAHSAT